MGIGDGRRASETAIVRYAAPAVNVVVQVESVRPTIFSTDSTLLFRRLFVPAR